MVFRRELEAAKVVGASVVAKARETAAQIGELLNKEHSDPNLIPLFDYLGQVRRAKLWAKIEDAEL